MKQSLWNSARGVQPLGGSRRGQSLVEFALVVPLFFLLLFGIIDIGRVMFVQMTLQHALREAGRFAVTGNKVDPDGPGPLSTLSRVDSIIYMAQQAAAGLDVSAISISSVSGGSVGAGRAGGPGDTVTVSLTANLRLITPMIGQFFGTGGVYTFTVSTTFRNEPFPPSSTL